MVQAGQYVTDGTAVFLVCDIRDGLQVGDIKLSPILRNGYVKANGALLTSARTNYPRLITFLTENPSLNAGDDTTWNSNKALYVYDSTADTLRVPDATGRVLQGGADVESVEAGVPNLSGLAIGLKYGAASYGPSGPFFVENGGTTATVAQGTSQNTSQNIKMDASRSNSIYGSSTTVQPPALSLIPQIKY